MNHYDAVLGAPDEHERKAALDRLIAELTRPMGFEKWHGLWDRDYDTPDFYDCLDRGDLREAYQAGRNYQREADAQIAELACEFILPADDLAITIAKAIREGDK